ncbi:MAG: hypothetical protein Q7K45_06140 [Nanoarchaeota archaeon]|nr:hypothetical protein [Nanoarchaeota archaeon]
MGFVLEELVVNEKGVFLTPEHGGQAVITTPVCYPTEIRVDGLGNPSHKPEVVDYLFRKHPDEIRGFTKGPEHDHKAPVQYFACKVIENGNYQQAAQK